jgi:hypothetical protein
VSERAEPGPSARVAGLVLLAWLVPAAGHVALGRRGRAAVFALVVATAALTGWALDGNLHRVVAGQPLSWLFTAGAMGLGAPYFLLRWVIGYHGEPTAPGFEYGTVFLLSAGLMNLLLVLDVLDIASGRKD